MIHVAEPQWESSSQDLFICSRWARVPGVHARCLMGPTSLTPCCSDGWEWWGGAPTTSPLLYTQTQMSRLISLWLGSKEIYPSTAVITPPWKHTLQHPSSLPFPLKSHYLCPLFELRSRWDRMEDVDEEWSEEITTARVQYRLSTGIPSQVGGSPPSSYFTQSRMSPEEI